MSQKKKLIAFEQLPFQLNSQEWNVRNSNPHYWKNDGVRTVFEYVYAPSFPEIESAYRKAKVKVFKPDGSVSLSEAVKDLPEIIGSTNLFDLEDGLFDDVRPKSAKIQIEAEDLNEIVVDKSEPLTTADYIELDELPPQPDARMKWRDLSWPEMRGLALSLKPETPRAAKKVDIVAVLEQCEVEGLI